MKNVASADKRLCLWTPGHQAAFGHAAHRLGSTLFLALARQRQEEGLVGMDPAVLEEMMGHWSLQDSWDLSSSSSSSS